MAGGQVVHSLVAVYRESQLLCEDVPPQERLATGGAAGHLGGRWGTFGRWNGRCLHLMDLTFCRR